MKKVKRIIGVLLAFVMVLCPFSPAVYALVNTGECACGICPQIYVGPLGNNPIIENAGTDEEKQLYRINDEATSALVKALAPAIAELALTQDYNSFGDVLISALKGTFGALALDGEGNSAGNVTCTWNYPTDSAHGKDSDFYFHYDWRLSPLEVAAELNDFIVYIKQLTGHGKVNLRASSMGGVVIMSYFSLYGYDDVDACVFSCCPILGTSEAGDLLCGKIKLDAQLLYKYGTQAYPPYNFENSLYYFLFGFLYRSGIADAVLAVGDKLIEKLGDRLYKEFLTPVFGTLLGLWAFVPDESYELAKRMNLDEAAQPGLVAKADEYHYSVQCRAREILTSAESAGVRIMIVAGCSMGMLPLLESANNNSDCTVDTKYASAGATVALLGEILSDEYISSLETDKYLSPDRTIDASTCILPDSTWFIADMLHSNNHDGTMALYRWFMYADEKYTVDSDENYPQYLLNDKKNEKLLPLTTEEDYKMNDTSVEKIAAYFEMLFATIRSFFNSSLR